LGREFGGIGILVAVEFDGEHPMCRSRYIVIVRKGVRYPDDIWFSKRTNNPITQPGHTDLSEARFVFQSREPYSASFDIFIAKFDGTSMYNLTEDNHAADDSFFDSEGNEVVEWVDEKRIRYSSMQGGVRKTVIGIDPLYKNM
jgi:hypothetical protein